MNNENNFMYMFGLEKIQIRYFIIKMNTTQKLNRLSKAQYNKNII